MSSTSLISETEAHSNATFIDFSQRPGAEDYIKAALEELKQHPYRMEYACPLMGKTHLAVEFMERHPELRSLIVNTSGTPPILPRPTRDFPSKLEHVNAEMKQKYQELKRIYEQDFLTRDERVAIEQHLDLCLDLESASKPSVKRGRSERY